MASLAEYLDGVVLVPLHLLVSDGFSECPDTLAALAEVWDFERFLHNVTKPITGLVCPNTTMEMCEKMGVTLAAFRRTLQPRVQPCTNLSVKVNCLVGDGFLDKARRVLGGDYQCMVRIYSIPPELPGLYSDGQICRQLVLQSANMQYGTDWDKFMKRLRTGKQRHIKMIMGHQSIWKAMQRVARFPGLWEDILIGNFAKNLAAHLDDAIVRFWNHIDSIWMTIFHGLETYIPLLDVESVRCLQYKAPASSEEDLKALMALFRQGMLLPKIQDPEHRAILWRNISSIRVIIPSIFTFHQNFSFITIGVKLMEKHLMCKDKSRPSKGPGGQPLGLLGRLEAQWVSTSPVIEVEHRVFRPTGGSPSLNYSFLAVLLLVLRHFPYLGSDAPREDVKGEAMTAYIANNCLYGLYEAAHSHGFRSDNINSWSKFQFSSYTKPSQKMYGRWRGGRPTISVYEELTRTGYLGVMVDAKPLTPAWVLDHILTAFFGDILHRYGVAGIQPVNPTANEGSRPVAPAEHTVVPISSPQPMPLTTTNPGVDVAAATVEGLGGTLVGFPYRPESVRSGMAPDFPMQDNPVQNVTPLVMDEDVVLTDRPDSVRFVQGIPSALKSKSAKPNNTWSPYTGARERQVSKKGRSPHPPARNTRASRIRTTEGAAGLSDSQTVLSSNNPSSDSVPLVPGQSIHQHAPENSREPPGDIQPSALAAQPNEARASYMTNRSDYARSAIQVLEPHPVDTPDSVLPNESMSNQSSTVPIGHNGPPTGPELEESLKRKRLGHRSRRENRKDNQPIADRVVPPSDTVTEKHVPIEELSRSGNINSSRVASSRKNDPQVTRFPTIPFSQSHPNAPDQHEDEQELFAASSDPGDEQDGPREGIGSPESDY